MPQMILIFRGCNLLSESISYWCGAEGTPTHKRRTDGRDLCKVFGDKTTLSTCRSSGRRCRQLDILAVYVYLQRRIGKVPFYEDVFQVWTGIPLSTWDGHVWPYGQSSWHGNDHEIYLYTLVWFVLWKDFRPHFMYLETFGLDVGNSFHSDRVWGCGGKPYHPVLL